METSILKIIQKAKESPTPSLFRIAIDNLNEDTKQIIDRLWDWQCVFIVTSDNSSYLSKVNFDYMNRSYSMGRYYYTTPVEIYRQPCELLVLCKDNYDSINSFGFAKETIKYYIKD